MNKIIFAISMLICSICNAGTNHPVTLVVPYGPGGTLDLIARYLQTDLENILHTTVVVKNLPGAGNLVAVNQVLNNNDCCTFIVSQDDFILGPMYQNRTTYQQFTATNIIGTMPFLMYGSVNQLQQQIQKKKTVNVGNNGVHGSADHWMAGLKSPIQLNPIYYKGAADLIRDVTGGQCEYGISSITASYDQVKEKTLVPVMISSRQRNQLYPQVPTYLELGFRGAPALTWFGVFARKTADIETVNQVTWAIKMSIANNPRLQDLKPTGMNLINLSNNDADHYYLQQIKHFEKTRNNQ